MKKLVDKLGSSSSDDDKEVALTDIINHLNEHPLKLDNLKHELIAARGIEGCIAPLYTIMKNLDFIPESSTPDKLPSCVYRGEKRNPFEIVAHGGFIALGKSKSVVWHKALTSESIYVSTSSYLSIALEFACKYDANWVYKIKSNDGICTNDFLAPVKVHDDEHEIIFPYQVPTSQIEGVAIVVHHDSLATEFFPLDQTQKIVDAMRKLGIPY
jgi:hypothetical protein